MLFRNCMKIKIKLCDGFLDNSEDIKQVQHSGNISEDGMHRPTLWIVEKCLKLSLH